VRVELGAVLMSSTGRNYTRFECIFNLPNPFRVCFSMFSTRFERVFRLVPEVLSVCTVQFKAVCDAIKSHAKRSVLHSIRV
jgi:hypothetical protein